MMAWLRQGNELGHKTSELQSALKKLADNRRKISIPEDLYPEVLVRDFPGYEG